MASSSKARFEANAEQGSEEVIGKLQEDFVKLFQFIVNVRKNQKIFNFSVLTRYLAIKLELGIFMFAD